MENIISIRTDSDIFSPYSMIDLTGMNNQSSPTKFKSWRDLILTKKKKVAWFVTNCKTPSKREQFVTELQKHIPVDIYGQCGPLKCPYRGAQCCNYLFLYRFAQ